jgi:hypothetical protein
METAAALRGIYEAVHRQTEGVIGDCSPEALTKVQPGATIGAIAGIYAHVVFAEDRQVNAMVQGKPTVLESGGWHDKIGIDLPAGPTDFEWRSNYKMDLPKFMEYARAVYAATDNYLANASEAEMEREFEGFGGRMVKVGNFLSANLGTHLPLHLGEIAALKGVQGLKGLP